jgi:mono/diheme cytochrome c family protein
MRASRLKTGTVLAGAWILAALPGNAGAAEKAVTYENTIKQIMSQRCMGCHGSDAPTLEQFDKDKAGWAKKFKGPRMDSYTNLVAFVNGSDAGALMRRLDDGRNSPDGKPGNMYASLGGTDAERAQALDLFKKWVGNWTLKRRKELSEAELRTIAAPEK